jgi:hypothetical protein
MSKIYNPGVADCRTIDDVVFDRSLTDGKIERGAGWNPPCCFGEEAEMAVFRVLGEQLVSENEFIAKGADIVRGMRAAGEGSDPGPTIRLADDQAFSFDVVPVAGGAAVTPFTPVSFGSPLTIDIRHVWSGGVGTKNGFLGGGSAGDIAVVSGVKDWSAFKASARALNWVAPRTGKQAIVRLPGALQDGTRIIAYQKAIASKQLTITVELAAAPRENDIFDRLGSAFSAAAGVPLMLPYAGALLAAGQIVPAVGKLLGAITRGESSWSQSEDLNFGVAGTADADAGFRVIAAASANFAGLRFKAGTGLVDANGQAFAGTDPYVVIAVDGTPASDLEAFTPTVVSAELMRRFHQSESGAGGIIDDLLDLTTIISDVKFREEAMKVREQMAANPGDKAKLQPRFDALVKNIVKAELKPA